MDEIQNISREINFMKFKGPFNTFEGKGMVIRHYKK